MTVEQIEVDTFFRSGDLTFVKTSWSEPSSLIDGGRCHRCFRVARGLNGPLVQPKLVAYFDDTEEISLEV